MLELTLPPTTPSNTTSLESTTASRRLQPSPDAPATHSHGCPDCLLSRLVLHQIMQILPEPCIASTPMAPGSRHERSIPSRHLAWPKAQDTQKTNIAPIQFRLLTTQAHVPDPPAHSRPVHIHFDDCDLAGLNSSQNISRGIGTPI